MADHGGQPLKNCVAVVKEKAFLPLGEIVEVVAKYQL